MVVVDAVDDPVQARAEPVLGFEVEHEPVQPVLEQRPQRVAAPANSPTVASTLTLDRLHAVSATIAGTKIEHRHGRVHARERVQQRATRTSAATLAARPSCFVPDPSPMSSAHAMSRSYYPAAGSALGGLAQATSAAAALARPAPPRRVLRGAALAGMRGVGLGGGGASAAAGAGAARAVRRSTGARGAASACPARRDAPGFSLMIRKRRTPSVMRSVRSSSLEQLGRCRRGTAAGGTRRWPCGRSGTSARARPTRRGAAARPAPRSRRVRRRRSSRARSSSA